MPRRSTCKDSKGIAVKSRPPLCRIRNVSTLQAVVRLLSGALAIATLANPARCEARPHQDLPGPSNPPSEPASRLERPLSQQRILELLHLDVASARIRELIEQNGIDFETTEVFLRQVRTAGGTKELLAALRNGHRAGSTARDHLARARELEKTYAFAEAEQEYRAVLQTEMSNPSARLGLGKALVEQEKFDEAVLHAQETARLMPDSARAHAILGDALAGKQRLDQALVEYRKALSLEPDSSDGHLGVGSVLFLQGHLERALAEFREVVRLKPDDPEAHQALAAALVDKEEYDSAIAESRQALSLNPTNAEAHMMLAWAFLGKGNQESAVAEARQAVTYKPGLADAHEALGLALILKGEANAGLEALREAIRLKPNDSGYHYTLGQAFENSGDTRGALEQYRAASALEPGNSQYRSAYQRLLRPPRYGP